MDQPRGRAGWLPRIRGLKGYSVTLDAAGVPPHALFVDYRTADGRSLEPEIFPRPDGSVYVCGMADPQPLPDSPEGVVVDDAACAVLARAAGRVSTTLAAAPITRRQACYRPVTDDGLPLIGRVPGVSHAYVATGHGPWGMLNAPGTGFALAELLSSTAPPRRSTCAPSIPAAHSPPLSPRYRQSVGGRTRSAACSPHDGAVQEPASVGTAATLAVVTLVVDNRRG